ncbi:MAG: trypsin-like serine protease [Erythrobacter sp.]
MRIASLFLIIALALLLTGMPPVANAQPAPTPADDATSAEQPAYISTGTPKAPTGKPAEQIATERLAADASEQACEGGDLSACNNLGLAFELGEGREQSRPVAAILFEQACEGGIGDGCSNLGRLASISTSQTIRVTADSLQDRACDMGSLAGCTELAISILNERDEDAGVDRAEALLRFSCDGGYDEGCRELGKFLLPWERGEASRGEGLDLLDRLCKGGSVNSCIELLGIFSDRPPHPRRPERTQTLHDACAAKDARSCKNLGDEAMTGGALPQDFDFAQATYDRACAIQPDLCYAAQNLRKAAPAYRACQAGDTTGCTQVALLQYKGMPRLIDDQTALSFLTTACLERQADACAPAASLIPFDETDPVARTRQTILLAEQGCELEDMSACRILVRALRSSPGDQNNTERALEVVGRLCENGDLAACEELRARQANGEDAPLPTADASFTPPTPLGEEPVLYRMVPDPSEVEESCRTTTVVFRGRTYTDRICRPMEAVINGYALLPGQAPWQALLFRPKIIGRQTLSEAQRVKCGGSLIRTGWILTAAHCLKEDGRKIVNDPDYRVRLGVFNPREKEGISFPILKVFPHPSYQRSDLSYDIALIKYDHRNGDRGDKVQSIAQIAIDRKPLSQRPINDGMPVYTYGWGWTEATNSTSSDKLMGVKLELQNRDACTEVTGFRNRSKLHSALCAGRPDGGQACSGDSGGPLIYYGDGDKRPKVIGVVSGGRGCGSRGIYSQYTRVARAREWIDRIIRNNP